MIVPLSAVCNCAEFFPLCL